MIRSFTRLLPLVGCTAAMLPALAASLPDERVPVDVELVLAVDISYSMDYDELALQREGYIGAITSKPFIDAIQKGAYGRIAITFVEWAGANDQRVVLPWQLIDGQATAEDFAQKLLATPLRRAYRTSISGAIKFSAGLFGTGGFKGHRKVIDVSGDGTNNQGDLVEPTRDEAVAKGITINGLPIQLKTPLASMVDIPDLHIYYEDCVIGGPGAFVVPVRDRDQFPDAIRKKLLLEVAGIMPVTPVRKRPLVIQVASPPRVSCTIGEQMWQRRWGGGG